jgi:F0F1-type ATP synthase assembly protein I
VPASIIPQYSVHAVGGQLNYILPAKIFSLFFKGYHEYSASSHTLGNTIVFGGAWTLLIPKPPAPKS